ncbi:MAG: NUDIX hydrolase domain-like protein [Benniella sp.]|nr:MAG: NUDIX hydrolase domain-like protein [Benniella sp.]
MSAATAVAVVLTRSPIKSRSRDLIQSGLRSSSRWSCQRHRFSSVRSCPVVSWSRVTLAPCLQQRKSSNSTQRYYTTETQGGFSSVEPFTTTATTTTTITTTAPTSALSSIGNTIRYDEAFFNLCRKRLEEKSDTSPYFQYCKEDPVRQASVFMPLCIHKGVPSVLFTIRAKNMRNHRGEVSFPGGKRDPTDETILDTALREMEEEISISRDQVEVLGEFAPMPNKDCTMRVHPFVGFIKEPIEDIESIVFNPDEVYKVFTVPMDELIDPERRSMVRFRTSKFLYPVWRIDAEDITIWGLTAFILDGVLRRIAKEGPTDAMEIPEGVNVEKYIPPTQSA